jgi:hypothetical protein
MKLLLFWCSLRHNWTVCVGKHQKIILQGKIMLPSQKKSWRCIDHLSHFLYEM